MDGLRGFMPSNGRISRSTRSSLYGEESLQRHKMGTSISATQGVEVSGFMRSTVSGAGCRGQEP